ncbi:hypothetical protein E3Q13_03302 [Wallemia mellicola]|nr:hypothetical protein E3Q13_03302 [Wallemia mellicola]
MSYFPKPFNSKDYKPPDQFTELAKSKEEKNYTEDDVNFKRYISNLKLGNTWDLIAAKYGNIDAEVDDEVDILTGEIISDRGHLRNLERITFGGRSKTDGDDDQDNSDDNSEHERELLEQHQQLMQKQRMIKDKEDLEAFLIADKDLHADHEDLYKDTRKHYYEMSNRVELSDDNDWQDDSASRSDDQSDDSVEILEKRTSYAPKSTLSKSRPRSSVEYSKARRRSSLGVPNVANISSDDAEVLSNSYNDSSDSEELSRVLAKRYEDESENENSFDKFWTEKEKKYSEYETKDYKRDRYARDKRRYTPTSSSSSSSSSSNGSPTIDRSINKSFVSDISKDVVELGESSDSSLDSYIRGRRSYLKSDSESESEKENEATKKAAVRFRLKEQNKRIMEYQQKEILNSAKKTTQFSLSQSQYSSPTTSPKRKSAPSPTRIQPAVYTPSGKLRRPPSEAMRTQSEYRPKRPTTKIGSTTDKSGLTPMMKNIMISRDRFPSPPKSSHKRLFD